TVRTLLDTTYYYVSISYYIWCCIMEEKYRYCIAGSYTKWNWYTCFRLSLRSTKIVVSTRGWRNVGRNHVELTTCILVLRYYYFFFHFIINYLSVYFYY